MDAMKTVLGITAGGAAGYLWYRILGCSSGKCPLAGNPYISVIFGAVVGFLLATNR